MSENFILAQKAAWRLARTLMAPVVLFRIENEEYGVMPADELDDADVEILVEYDPYSGGRSVH
jgi:hypothetical protein